MPLMIYFSSPAVHRSTLPTSTRTTAKPQSLSILTPTSRLAVSSLLQTTSERHKAALKILAIKFSKEELASSNCSGTHGKQKLDQTRLALVKSKCGSQQLNHPVFVPK